MLGLVDESWNTWWPVEHHQVDHVMAAFHQISYDVFFLIFLVNLMFGMDGFSATICLHIDHFCTIATLLNHCWVYFKPCLVLLMSDGIHDDDQLKLIKSIISWLHSIEVSHDVFYSFFFLEFDVWYGRFFICDMPSYWSFSLL